MAGVKVANFGFMWFPHETRGAVSIYLEDGQSLKFKITSVAELAGYAAILKEEPIFWDPDKERLGTGWEPVEGD